MAALTRDALTEAAATGGTGIVRVDMEGRLRGKRFRGGVIGGIDRLFKPTTRRQPRRSLRDRSAEPEVPGKFPGH